MTVKELIEELQDYPQDAQVITESWHSWVTGELKTREPFVDYDQENNIIEIN